MFPGHPVQPVGELLHIVELGQHQGDHCAQHSRQHRYRRACGRRPLPTFARNFQNGPHRQDRGLEDRLEAQGGKHLDLLHVVGGAGDETGGGEAAQFLHGEVHGFIVHRFPQPHGQPRRNPGYEIAHDGGRRQAPQGAQQHGAPRPQYSSQFTAGGLHQSGDLPHIVGEAQIQPYAADDEYQPAQRIQPIPSFHIFQYFQHRSLLSVIQYAEPLPGLFLQPVLPGSSRRSE